MLKRLKRYMIYILSILMIISLATLLVLNMPQFGKNPSGDRLKAIENSPNFKNRQFTNQSETPMFTGEGGTFGMLKAFIFGNNTDLTPTKPIPSIKTDLRKLEKDTDLLVWFGHSSYFMQIGGKTILVDPILSGYASPFSFSVKAFYGADIYKPEDMPEIDYLFITHDHWDHLDYNAIMKLKPRIKQVICGLGVGAHFEHWGFDKKILVEQDWNTQVTLDSGFVVNFTPARHFSGRGLTRNQSLWTSFLIETPSKKIFIGGDGGYDKHFAEIGEKFGPIDLAMLENGQYNLNWKYIHMLPEEVAKAADDLKAKQFLAVHNSKFKLAMHPWYEPLERVSEAAKSAVSKLITPKIGEVVYLNDSAQKFSEWWK